jgi:serine/threonine protein kinase
MIPDLIGKYKVVRLLGRGGMADVYEARDTLLDRRVAIKTIHPHLVDDNKFLQRFQHEAKLLASLRHPHIVRFYDFDLYDGRPFMVMEYLGGGTLSNKFADLRAMRKRLPQAEMLQILDAIAAALDYAHAHDAIHRDIKPANILFTADGVPVVTDFGITKILTESLHMSLTGSVIGTPSYMAPEQASSGKIDRRTDIYALGVMLYEMATGRTPFQGNNPTDIIIKHMTASPPAPRQFNPDIPKRAQDVILKSLAKDPANRFDTAGEFARAFHTALESEPSLEDMLEISQESPTVIEDISGYVPSSLQILQPPTSDPLSEPLSEANLPSVSSITPVEQPRVTKLTPEEAVSYPSDANSVAPLQTPLPAVEQAQIGHLPSIPQPVAKTPKSRSVPVATAKGQKSPDQASLPAAQAMISDLHIRGWLLVQNFNKDLAIPPEKSEILIGREDPFHNFSPEINLDPYGGQDAGVSRRHACIRLQEGKLVVEDLNTTNGTLLNKRRLTPGEVALLSDGDELCLGKIILIYHTQ